MYSVDTTRQHREARSVSLSAGRTSIRQNVKDCNRGLDERKMHTVAVPPRQGYSPLSMWHMPVWEGKVERGDRHFVTVLRLRKYGKEVVCPHHCWRVEVESRTEGFQHSVST